MWLYHVGRYKWREKKKQHSTGILQTDNTVITGKEAEDDEEGKSRKIKDAIGYSFETKKVLKMIMQS